MHWVFTIDSGTGTVTPPTPTSPDSFSSFHGGSTGPWGELVSQLGSSRDPIPRQAKISNQSLHCRFCKNGNYGTPDYTRTVSPVKISHFPLSSGYKAVIVPSASYHGINSINPGNALNHYNSGNNYYNTKYLANTINDARRGSDAVYLTTRTSQCQCLCHNLLKEDQITPQKQIVPAKAATLDHRSKMKIKNKPKMTVLRKMSKSGPIYQHSLHLVTSQSSPSTQSLVSQSLHSTDPSNSGSSKNVVKKKLNRRHERLRTADTELTVIDDGTNDFYGKTTPGVSSLASSMTMPSLNQPTTASSKPSAATIVSRRNTATLIQEQCRFGSPMGSKSVAHSKKHLHPYEQLSLRNQRDAVTHAINVVVFTLCALIAWSTMIYLLASDAHVTMHTRRLILSIGSGALLFRSITEPTIHLAREYEFHNLRTSLGLKWKRKDSNLERNQTTGSQLSDKISI